MTVTFEELVYTAVRIMLECVTMCLLADTFFSRKRTNRTYYLSAAILIIVEFLSSVLPYGKSTALKYVLTISSLTLWQLFNFRANLSKCLFVSCLGISYLIVFDFIILSALSAIVPIMDLYSDPGVFYTILFGMKLVEFSVIAVIQTWGKYHFHRQEAAATDWILGLLFPSSTLIISVYCGNLFWNNVEYAGVFLLPTIILAFVDVGAVILLDSLGKKQATIRNNAVLRQNLKLETEHIATMEKAYDHQRAQTHDFKNQLSVLRSMAEQNAPRSEFVEYLNSVLATDIPSVIYINTHRTVVDIIMSQKVSLAKDKGIDFQFELDNLSSFPLPDDALVVVLTNLIDNAVEACEKIPHAADRHILLKMKMEKHNAILNIENTTSGPVVIRDNTVQTTKDNPMAHGYGLKNVAAMIERSGGMWFIEYRDKDKRFCFSASLPRTKE